MKNLSRLIEKISPTQINGNSNFEITGIAYDSRKVKPGMLFVAIKGNNADGHEFIGKALESGAKAVICEHFTPNSENLGNCFIIVENSREALADISHAYYDFPAEKLQIFGITGTNGKTTTTFILKSIFEKSKIKTGLIGTTGNYSGERRIESTHTTPESLELAALLNEMLDDGVSNVVMEVSSHALHQGRLRGIKFAAGLFSNLTHDHLDYHKTMEEYADAKRILFKNISGDGIAVINADSEWADYMVEGSTAGKIVKVGTKHPDYLVYHRKLSIEGISFTLKFDGINLYLKSRLLGEFNIDNAALAAVTAIESGVDPSCVAGGLCETKGAPGRMSVVKLNSGAIGVVDYAHTPDALEKALKASRDILEKSENPNGRLICVFGCGGDRDPMKRPIMAQISAKIASYTVITSDNPRTEDPDKIISEIIAGIIDMENIGYENIPDRREAIKHACVVAEAGDLILVAGKGHENYQIIGSERIHFDDMEELAKFEKI